MRDGFYKIFLSQPCGILSRCGDGFGLVDVGDLYPESVMLRGFEDGYLTELNHELVE